MTQALAIPSSRQLPIIDLKNPLYCPEVSAHQFLASARLLQASLDDARRFSFLRKLCEASALTETSTVFSNANSNSTSSSGTSSASFPSTSGTERTPTDPSVASLNQLDSPKDHPVHTKMLLLPQKRGLDFEENSYSDDFDSVSVHLKAKSIPSDRPSNNNTDNHNHESKFIIIDDAKFNSKRTTANPSLAHSEQSASSDDTSDLIQRPFKKVKRSSSVVESSFVLSTKPKPLCFPLPPKTTLDLLDTMGGSDYQWRTTSDANIASEGNDLVDEDGGADWFWPDNNLKFNVKTNGSKRGGGTVKYKGGTRVEAAISGSMGEDPRKGPKPFKAAETPACLEYAMEELEKLLPGVRLWLSDEKHTSMTSYQDMINILGLKGHLTPEILLLFRDAPVYSLNLTESMADAVDGLNLKKSDILKVFKISPTCFQKLTRLYLSDVHLCDDDLMNLSNLISLSTLFLEDTRIGDVAMMHLVALRKTLVHLEVSDNERITDDATPCFLAMEKLEFVSVKATGVTKSGLERLINEMKKRGRKLRVECDGELQAENAE